jgi:hypothetical protein
MMQVGYWGGLASAAAAVLYKLLLTLGICSVTFQVFPRHLWQLSFLLFILSIATYTNSRMRGA